MNENGINNASDIRQEKVACPVCGDNGPFESLGVVNDYVMLRCNKCYLEFAESMRYDPGYYENIHYAEDENLKDILALSRRDFLNRASKLIHSINWQPQNIIFKWIGNNIKQGSTILDIGCGVGWFIAALESVHFRAIGIEVSTNVVNMLKNKGFELYLGPIEQIDKNIPAPDLITLLAVIEHVKSPIDLLKDIRNRFPNAKLMVSIPSPKRWDLNVIGERTYCEYPPNHLTPSWSENTLKIALEKAGFRLAEWLYPPPIADEMWFIYIDWLLLRIGLRKKGYFVGLTNKAVKSDNILSIIINIFYPLIEKFMLLAKYAARPLLSSFAEKLRKEGYSGLTAVALAYPVK